MDNPAFFADFLLKNHPDLVITVPFLWKPCEQPVDNPVKFPALRGFKNQADRLNLWITGLKLWITYPHLWITWVVYPQSYPQQA